MIVSLLCAPMESREGETMPTKISLGIFVGGQKREHFVDTVEVTQDQVRAAITVWDSAEMTEQRESWVKHKGDTKVFWCNDRCYPPKQLMRIACREQVKEIATRQNKIRFKQELEDGLRVLRGGYQVLKCYQGARDLGYRTDSLAPDSKAKYGS